MSMEIFSKFEIDCLFTFYVAENSMWDPEPEVIKSLIVASAKINSTED